MSKELTRNQRQALECLRRAQASRIALSAQAREQGLSVRVIYDAVAALRRKGVLPTVGSDMGAAAGDFVAVRVAPPAMHSTPAGAVVCHVRVGTTLISCQQWPPAAWLATLGQAGADAAAAGH